MPSRELTAFRNHCALMAQHSDAPDSERALWQMLADEVDAYRRTTTDLEPDLDRTPTEGDVPLA